MANVVSISPNSLVFGWVPVGKSVERRAIVTFHDSQKESLAQGEIRLHADHDFVNAELYPRRENEAQLVVRVEPSALPADSRLVSGTVSGFLRGNREVFRLPYVALVVPAGTPNTKE